MGTNEGTKEDNSNPHEGSSFLAGIGLGILLSLIIMAYALPEEKTSSYYKNGYKDGQVECIKGNIKYEIVNVTTVKEKEK